MKPLTVERALAEASKAGCTFRLAGAGVVVRGLDQLPPSIADFLRAHRSDVFSHLGGDERDRPPLNCSNN
jgi:hypothetical protein